MASRPVAYLRRSNAGNGNGKNSGRVSFDAQRAAVLELAARRGDPEPELVVEWGVSGADASGAGKMGGTGRGGRRRVYHELRARIDAGQVSALYAYSLSRLARSTRELLDLAEACVAHGVPIRLAKEGDIDGTSPAGRLYLTVLAAVSTFEAEVSAERAHDRNEQMKERGAFIGRPPYGYLLADGRLVPDPVATPVVDRVLRLYRDLRSPAKVARALNEAGVPAPQGGSRGWGDGTVRRILARQPGARPPATVRGSRAVPTATFARLLRCHCGATLTPARKRYTTAAGQARVWVGYTCPAARYGRGHGPTRAVAESVILAAAKVEAERLRLPDRVEVETQAEAQRAELDARRGRIIDALESGVITRAEAEPRLDAIKAEVTSLEVEIDTIDIPGLDWNWRPETINSVLVALWERIELGLDMLPIPPSPERPAGGFARRVAEWWAD